MNSTTSKKMSVKKMLSLGFIFFVTLMLIIFSGSMVEFVNRGQYHVIQYPSGTMRAVFDTGPYAQWFGSVSPWPTSETFYFTSDKEGGEGNYAIKNVQFRDGSFVAISGTTRVILPSDPEKAIGLMIHHNYKNFSDLEDRLILPTVRAAFIRTANLMTAQESYSSKRADFINWAWDQIENGLYKTIEVTRDVPRADDPNRTERKIVREIMYDKAGVPLREKNPLDGTGIRLANFEIKEFQYDETVVKQIADQQKNLMGIETAKAEAERAKQDAIKLRKRVRRSTQQRNGNKKKSTLRKSLKQKRTSALQNLMLTRSLKLPN